MLFSDKQIPHHITRQIVRSPQRWEIYKEYLRRYMGIALLPWQEQELLNMMRYNRYILNWGRGMSKTLMLSIFATYLGILGMRTGYAVPRVSELDQPSQYFNGNPFVDANPYKRSHDKSFNYNKRTWFKILGQPAITITNVDDHGENLSGPRLNAVLYDECALLMFKKKEKELLNKGKGQLRAMPHPRVIYASTPLIGSHFYTIYESAPEEERSWRNFENTTPNFITDTQEKKNLLLQERQWAVEQGTLFAWETENLAIPRTFSGAAFKNIRHTPIETFPSQIPTHVGFDFHGHLLGHIWVAFYYRQTREKQHIYIIDEGAEVYDQEATADESMEFLGQPYFQGIENILSEAGGMINDPYVNAGRQFGLQGVNIQGHNKRELEANILNYMIHIDKNRTPNIWEDLKHAQWKDPNKFILLKEPSGTKFRNHYLDAFSSALPQYQQGDVYIPNRNLRYAGGSDVVAADMDRERTRWNF